MKETKNSWQKSVTIPSVTRTISFESSKKELLKATVKGDKQSIQTNEEFSHRRYSFDDNGGGYMGL